MKTETTRPDRRIRRALARRTDAARDMLVRRVALMLDQKIADERHLLETKFSEIEIKLDTLLAEVNGRRRLDAPPPAQPERTPVMDAAPQKRAHAHLRGVLRRAAPVYAALAAAFVILLAAAVASLAL